MIKIWTENFKAESRGYIVEGQRGPSYLDFVREKRLVVVLTQIVKQDKCDERERKARGMAIKPSPSTGQTQTDYLM